MEEQEYKLIKDIGYKAFIDGNNLSQNPFCSDSQQESYSAWEDGFSDANWDSIKDMRNE